LATLADSSLHEATRIEVLTNGENFYEAQLAAIRQAKRSINLEAYIFQKGVVTRRFVDAMTERARNGVKVNIVLDAIGSFATWNSYFKDLKEAGGRVEWYHGFKWHQLPRLNSRTHREILVVDCEVAFVGGAGYADHWLISKKKHPRWRDTVCRMEGDAVSAVQATFVENWLEASGELLTEDEYFCFNSAPSDSVTLVIDSSLTSGQSTRARMLFQTLIASAKDRIEITTPYFLPDKGLRRELIRAVERGVRVMVVCPGRWNDHILVRQASRRLYGSLLEAGAEIHEYGQSMIHAKVLVIDSLWSVYGTDQYGPPFVHNQRRESTSLRTIRISRSASARTSRANSRKQENHRMTCGSAVLCSTGSRRFGTAARTTTVKFRIATYNVHKCKGLMAVCPLNGFADVICELGA
jgi:cardiolipin synthase